MLINLFQRVLAMEEERTEQLIRPSTEDEDSTGRKNLPNLRKRRQNKTKSNLEGPKGLYNRSTMV